MVEAYEWRMLNRQMTLGYVMIQKNYCSVILELYGIFPIVQKANRTQKEHLLVEIVENLLMKYANFYESLVLTWKSYKQE